MTPAACVDDLRTLLESHDRPLVVGIDGPSGAGKSALARLIHERHSPELVTVIEGDDFYRGGSAHTWDARSAATSEEQVIDWRHQQRVIEQLLTDGVTSWHPFDWSSSSWDTDDAPLAPDPVHARRAPLIVLEGVYSCRPQLHQLLDRRILVDARPEVRWRRMRLRDGHGHRADWNERWSRAEQHYFAHIMPPRRFDIIVDNA